MVSEQDLRRELAAAARLLYQRGLVSAYEGNLSARWPGGAVRRTPLPMWLCSPTRRCKGELEARDFVKVDGAGQVVGSGCLSTEADLHLGIYRHLPEACAVVHAHPPHATAFACTKEGLVPILQPELLLLLGGPVPLAPYARPGSAALFESVRPLLARSAVILLANHGVVAVSRESVRDAVHLLDQVEQVARVTLLARQLGNLQPLPERELQQLLGTGGSGLRT